MAAFQLAYVPAGVPTFHLESAQEQFDRSSALLRNVEPDVVLPEKMPLTLDGLAAYLDTLAPNAIVFQNLTFANAAYMSEVLRRFRCPVLLWTLREPVIDGGRLRLNSLTGAYSAANTLRVFGAPDEAPARDAVESFAKASRVNHARRSLRMAAGGHTPQRFGRALEALAKMLDIEVWR